MYRVIAVLCLAAAIFSPAGQKYGYCEGGERWLHDGRVVNGNTQEPVSVDIKAFEASPGYNDPCSSGGGKDLLDSRRSSVEGGGVFTLHIPKGKGTYTAVYCSNHYVTRVDSDIPNSRDDDVVPKPAEVLPKNLDSKSIREVVFQKTAGVLYDLAYIKKSYPGLYEQFTREVIGQFEQHSKARSEALVELLEIVKAWEEAE